MTARRAALFGVVAIAVVFAALWNSEQAPQARRTPQADAGGPPVHLEPRQGNPLTKANDDRETFDGLTLVGILADEEGNPVQATLVLESEMGEELEVKTTNEGEFALNAGAGHWSAHRIVEPEFELAASNVVEVDGTRRSPTLKVLARRLSWLEGIVTDQERTPLAGAWVNGTRSSAAGRFRVLSTPERLSASHSCCWSYDPERGVEEDGGVFIRLTRPQLMRSLAMVSGIVVDSKQRPVRGAWVRMTLESFTGTHRPETLATDTHGEFEFPLFSDSAVVTATLGERASEPTSVRVGSRVTLTLASPRRVRGRVITEDGRPIERFSIQTNGWRWQRFVSPSGRFVAEVPDSAVLSVFCEGRAPVQIMVPDEFDDLGDVVFSNQRPVRGQVVARGGGPVPGAELFAESERVTTTDANGNYELFLSKEVLRVGIQAAGFLPRSVELRPGMAPTIVLAEPDRERDAGMGNRIEGVGIAFESARKELIVDELHANGSAIEAGIQRGDELLAIDGVDVSTLTLEQSLSRTKGPAGTSVRLTFRRDGHIFDRTLVRRHLDW